MQPRVSLTSLNHPPFKINPNFIRFSLSFRFNVFLFAIAGSFITEQLRMVHLQNHHNPSVVTEIATFVCEFCAKQFVSMNSLRMHISNIHSDAKVQCQICQKWLKHSKSLKTHMEKHSSRPQQCPHCDKRSPNSTALLSHIRRMHESGPSFQCSLCTKAFKLATELKVCGNHRDLLFGMWIWIQAFCNM